MLSFQRFTFEGDTVEIDAMPPEDPIDGYTLVISFNSHEDFHRIVKRLAKRQPDEQVKLAYAALETEMGKRLR